MITQRATRLIRTPDLQGFRQALVSLCREGDALDARDRLVVVPTYAAAEYLVRTIEDGLTGGAVVLPDLTTRAELLERLATRLAIREPLLTEAEREALLGVSCRAAAESGTEPPFRVRPGLIAAILSFYDTLRRNQRDVATFSRLVLGMLEPGASEDRGARRLVRQTRFLAAAFEDFERRCLRLGLDEHELRTRLLTTAAERPYRHLVIAVADRAFDSYGLYPADWDLLARIQGLERLDLLVTETMLAGALHERLHHMLPGIEEIRSEIEPRAPLLEQAPNGAPVHLARDREEEIAGFARRVKGGVRRGELAALDRVALVTFRPLPYVYLAREVLRSAGIPCQMFDTLPLAAEPYAAALDLVLSAASADFARGPLVALLRSAHFRLTDGLAERAVDVLDRALGEAAFLGGQEALARLIERWKASSRTDTPPAPAVQAAGIALDVARQLAPLRQPAPAGEHLHVVIEFLIRHERPPVGDDPLRQRRLRARGAILGLLRDLRGAYARLDPTAVDFDTVAALVRRWVEGHTFAPRSGESGVHVVDAASAPFGDFDHVQLAGLVEGEWPDRASRSIFYSPSILRELGWPAESDRVAGSRAAFSDLLRLPARRVRASTFTLESDTLVTPSSLVDEIDTAGLAAIEQEDLPVRIFESEALTLAPPATAALPAMPREWARLRTDRRARAVETAAGATSGHRSGAYSLSALERYQDCPFKFFSADVLRLEEPADDESSMSPRARGRFIHEVFERFFIAWGERGGGTITVDRLDAARELFVEVAAPLLERLPPADAALEHARLFGSAISVGLVDVTLGLEATRPAPVLERWLEHRFDGEFMLGSADCPPVRLRGVADRIDLLDGHRLRVVDYKTGYAPNVKRALQVPIYALCAQEQLADRSGGAWRIEEAAYIAFSGKRAFVPVVRPGESGAEDTLAAARERLRAAVAGIERGEFPPRPHDPMMCRFCAFARVCRKDYVGD